MRIVELPKGDKIAIRESAKELPIDRFTDFEKYLVQASGIGSTMGDVDRHFQALDRFMQSNKIEEALNERNNLHMNLYLMLNKISIKSIAFCCLIDSINGARVSDYSEKSMMELASTLGRMGLTEEHVADILESVKKNSILN